MKKMKRLVALVLAGMLALVMFTACDGTGSDDIATAKQMKEIFGAYLQEAIPKASMGKDSALQDILAEQTQLHWSKKSAAFKVDTEEGTAVIVVIGTYDRSYLFLLKTEEGKKKIVETFRNAADKGAQLYKTSVTKTEVYTAARGNEVIVSYVMLFPKTVE